MGWQDRQSGLRHFDGGGGRFRTAMRHVFGDGQNPLEWALPLYTLWGIRVRIHLVFVIFIFARLLFTIPQGAIGVAYVALAMLSLFTLVLLHEYGHCFACRRVGGEADQILMWPLGGLASCMPPNTWRAHFITVAGGPLVNVALWPILAGLLLAFGAGFNALVFNPFSGQAIGNILIGFDSLAMVWLWWLYFMNLILLGFNVLLPMYPMDGGRILQTLLWARAGYRRSMEVATLVGLVTAITLGVVVIAGRFDNQVLLLAIALFGGMTCWMERKRLQFMEDAGGFAGYDFSRGYSGFPEEEPDAGPSRRELKRREKAAREEAEVDRLLDKIARSGMHSLTKAERRFLDRHAQRRRNGVG